MNWCVLFGSSGWLALAAYAFYASRKFQKNAEAWDAAAKRQSSMALQWAALGAVQRELLERGEAMARVVAQHTKADA